MLLSKLHGLGKDSGRYSNNSVRTKLNSPAIMLSILKFIYSKVSKEIQVADFNDAITFLESNDTGTNKKQLKPYAKSNAYQLKTHTAEYEEHTHYKFTKHNKFITY